MEIVCNGLNGESCKAESIRRHLQPIAGALKELSLIEPAKPSREEVHGAPTKRGVFELLIVNLASVERLVIEPGAVSDLGLLAALPMLEELSVQAAISSVVQDVTAEEVIDLLTNSSSLRKLVIDVPQMQPWYDAQREEVARVANEKGIELKLQ